jgi:hypothetical protein
MKIAKTEHLGTSPNLSGNPTNRALRRHFSIDRSSLSGLAQILVEPSS